MKEINIVEIVELNEYGVRVEEQDLPLPLATRYFDDNGGSPEGNYDENNIAGTWVVLDGKHEIGTYAYRSIDHCTLVKEKDFRNYLMNMLKKDCIEMRPSKGIKKRARRAILSVGKSGGKRGGSSTFRATLPTSWIREMGLSEDVRDIKLEFDGERIIIKNNEEEIKLLEKLLEVAREKIKEEMADRKSTRLNSSHVRISYAVFCLKKKKKKKKKKQKIKKKKKKNKKKHNNRHRLVIKLKTVKIGNT